MPPGWLFSFVIGEMFLNWQIADFNLFNPFKLNAVDDTFFKLYHEHFMQY